MSFVPSLRKTRNQIAKASLSNNIQNENLRHPQPKKGMGLQAMKTNFKDRSKTSFGVKRKAETENCDGLKMATKKRSAFGDITNAIEKTLTKNGKAGDTTLKAQSSKSFMTKSVANLVAKNKHPVKAPVKEVKQPQKQTQKGQGKVRVEDHSESNSQQNETLDDSIVILSEELKINRITFEESNSYITASEGSPLVKKNKSSSSPTPPADVEDFDQASIKDPFAVSVYAMDIFNYYKERENTFLIEKYMNRQPDVSRTMRAILIDWMVEVQESFELNHETLYLAVKLVDLYLSKVTITRDRLQLIGSTAIFIACKFDERTPPFIDDFLYICDDAYTRKELISLEIQMLKALQYDLGIPLSYRFLRRYARCVKVNMETLTFARYILELSLMDYEFVDATDSVLAAAALFLALTIKEKGTKWSNVAKYYSGYDFNDFYHFVQSLHQMLIQPPKDHLKTIRNKYSHKVFFEVAKAPIPEHLGL